MYIMLNNVFTCMVPPTGKHQFQVYVSPTSNQPAKHPTG
jgi:hypothetical protein